MPTRTLTVLILLVLAAGRSWAGVVVLEPLQDNTLYEDVQGAVSNGAGQHLFIGRNSQGNTRRALLAFDLASAVPAGATITSVGLSIHVSQANPETSLATLHRLLQAWGEGSSDAPNAEGQGAPAEPGDATWLHTFHDSAFWSNPGGDFEVGASGDTLIAGPGDYLFASTAAMVADAQTWLDEPAANFGWLIMGDESGLGTARRLDSRENPEPAFRPMLSVEYTPIPGPAGWLLLTAAAARRRRRRSP